MAKVNRARKKIIEWYLFLYGKLVVAAEALSRYPDESVFKNAIKSYIIKLEEMVSDEAEFSGVALAIMKRPTAYGIPDSQI